MKITSLTPAAFLMLLAPGCSNSKVVEESNGVTTDRYTVDKDGLKHGEFRRYFGKDTLAELSNYVHGLLDGTRTIYDEHGNVEITETYVRDTMHGPYRELFDDGKVKREGEYVHGAMQGIWKRYYPDGGLIEEVTIVDNMENGPFVEYHENGKLRAKGQYLEGDFEHDTLYLFDEGGVLERKMLCDRGVCRTFWLSDAAKAAEAEMEKQENPE